MRPRGFSGEEVEKFYDALGADQDKQSYYEDVTLLDLVKHARFDSARSVVEFGCGTGRFAEDLLTSRLPEYATYWGCDVSSTMIELSRKRLAQFDKRVKLVKTAGDTELQLPNKFADRFVSNYVLDILSIGEISAVLKEAKRILKKDGLLCLTGLTFGKGVASKLWTAFWNVRFVLNPKWVGGCRPLALLDFLNGWEITHHTVVVARGISSEVVVAKVRE
ncbi:MAG: class I SAM-dependent methyltransferase [Anaerolineales bacterium]